MVGKKAAVVNNGTVKEIVVNSKGTVAIKNNGTIKKVTVQNAKSVSFSGNCKKAVPVVVNAEDVSMILAAPAKITAKKDVNIVLKKGAEKSSITCTKNVQAQVDNQTKKAISVKIADGTTLKVESGESCTITPKGKKEDTSGEDKTDGKDQKTDDTSDGNASSGSSSSGNSSGGTTVETPSKLTEADLLKQGYQLKWQDNFDGNFLNRADWNVELHEKGWVNSEWQEKELKETELKEAGLRIARKQDLLVFILSISVVLSILLYISFLYYRHLRSLKNQLQREKDLLLESQRRLMREKARAEEASLMKSAFLANMSHEIRTPLNAIVGFSSLLVEPSTDAKEREEYSSIIRNNTDLMLNLVNDVLDLSRMETGDLHFNIKDYPLLECCQMALESVRYRMPDGVKLTFSPAGEPIVVHVDNLRLQQLLTNLLTNAAKFTEKGEINLSFQLAPDREKVCIAVTDTGAGIPLEKQAAVFNRFEKLDDYKPGAGLGLSICLLIAERLNGSLSIDSSYTDGARFVLILSCEIDSSIYNPPIEV